MQNRRNWLSKYVHFIDLLTVFTVRASQDIFVRTNKFLLKWVIANLAIGEWCVADKSWWYLNSQNAPKSAPPYWTCLIKLSVNVYHFKQCGGCVWGKVAGAPSGHPEGGTLICQMFQCLNYCTKPTKTWKFEQTPTAKSHL